MNWWLEHGLDGILGGIAGGLATGAAVALTIWHERKHAADLELRTAVARVHSEAARMNFALDSTYTRPEFARWRAHSVELNVAAMEVFARGARRWPVVGSRVSGLASEVEHELDKGAGNVDPRQLQRDLTDLVEICQMWLADPSKLKDSLPGAN